MLGVFLKSMYVLFSVAEHFSHNQQEESAIPVCSIFPKGCPISIPYKEQAEKEHISENIEQRILEIFVELCSRKVKNEQHGNKTNKTTERERHAADRATPVYGSVIF